ncbi:hypothetical protein [Xenophilus azovorans]|uniref:hypothetical protein n=1 Tax=Xenophilus azovorans TaxID=151755 RepID=UPI00056DB40F|nr:hypothetical protein [Xenophilus azovorans]
MRIKSESTLYGIKASKGDFEGRGFDSCTFHLDADLASNTSGEAIGISTRPFKFGKADEFDKWKHLAKSLPLRVEVEFDVVAAAENKTSLSIVSIKPMERAKSA